MHFERVCTQGYCGHMPKRTNFFQDLIARIEQTLAPSNAKVTQSKILKDARTGEDREVDVYIDVDYGNNRITRIGIHCRDHKRKSGTPWVEQVVGMQADLPVDKTVLVSRSGFTKPAIKKAKSLKMDVMNFEEAKRADWSKFLLQKVSALLTRIEPIKSAIISPSHQFDLDNYLRTSGATNDLLIEYSSGEKRTLKSIIEEQVLSPAMHEEMKSKYISGQEVTINHRLPPDTAVGSFPVSEIKILTKFMVESADINLESALYEKAQITHGHATLLGDSVKVLATELAEK